MFSQEQIRQALARPGMQWTTPSGATGIPGFGFLQAPPVIAPPPPQVPPSQFIPSSGLPAGYAEMFQPAQPSIEASGAPGVPMATAGSSEMQPEAAPPASGDPSMVHQALLNLIGNANAGGAPGAPTVAAGSTDMAPPTPAPMPAPAPVVAPAAPAEAAPVPRNRPAALQGEASTYTIKKGDTLWALAKRFGTTVQALAKRNNIRNPDKIAVGRTLKL